MFKRDKRKRRVSQNTRLVNREFPWMWAVSAKWHLPEHDIKVLHHGALELKLTSKPSAIQSGHLLKVFIYIQRHPDWYEVIEVELREDCSLAECIGNHFSCGELVLYVVAVFDPPHEWRRVYHIYCPAKEPGHHNSLIVNASRMARGEEPLD